MKHKDPISRNDMAKLFASLDISTPQGLQDKVFIDMMYFANRGRENLRGMKMTDFIIEKNEEGLQYIIHRDMLTKTRRENDDEQFSGHMYAIPNSKFCS